jgi:hypothetical protein
VLLFITVPASLPQVAPYAETAHNANSEETTNNNNNFLNIMRSPPRKIVNDLLLI